MDLQTHLMLAELAHEMDELEHYVEFGTDICSDCGEAYVPQVTGDHTCVSEIA